MESGDDNEDEEEERGNGLSAFMFGNVGKDMQLEEDYMDEDAREQLAALGEDKLGGNVLDLQAESVTKPGVRPSKPVADRGGDAQNYSDEEEMAADESASAAPAPIPGSSQAPATLRAPIFVDLVEEDDYDADMDAEAAPLTSTTVSAVPAAAAVTQHTPAPAAVVAANGVAIQLPPTGLPPPGFAQLTAPLQVSVAASVADAAVTQAQLRRLLSLPDGEDEEAKPLLVAAPPQAPAAAPAAVPAAPSGALLQQLERAKAAGVDLPVLADLGSSAVLRFSELFAGDEVDADPPVAKAGKQRQPRSAEVPEEGAPGEDEEALLHGEDVEALEAEAWASEPDEDGEAGRAEGGESGDDDADGGPGDGSEAGKLRDQERKREPDAAVVQSAVPAKRTPRWAAGAEPLLGERERKGLADPDSVLDALPYAQFEALTQREWERDVVWAAEGADSSALRALQLSEDNDAESADEQPPQPLPDQQVQQQPQPDLAAVPAPLPEPPPEPNPAHAAQEASMHAAGTEPAAADTHALEEQGTDTQPGAEASTGAQAGAQAAPVPAAEQHQPTEADVEMLAPAEETTVAAMPAEEPMEGASQEELWLRPDPHAALEPLSGPAKAEGGHSALLLQPHVLRLEATLQLPAVLQDGAQEQVADGTAEQQQAALAQLATQWAKAAKLPNRALLDEYWLQGAALEAGCLPKPALLLDLNDPNMTFEMRQGHDTAELANAPATILPALPNVVPVMGPLAGVGEGAAQLARFNVSRDAAYSARARRKGDRVAAAPCKHATPAASLATLPVRHANRAELVHRPTAAFLPPPHRINIKVGSAELSLVKLSSVVGKDAIMQSFKDVALATTSAAALWEKAVSGKFEEAKGLEPVFWLRGQTIQRVPSHVSLRAAGVPADVSVELAVTFPALRLLPSRCANAVPDPSSGVPTRPPGAFMKKKDLTAADGHLILVEYLEERPLLLSRQGMGMRLSTHYRKRNPTDAGHQKLIKDNERWRAGQVEVLNPDDDSPFLLGDLKPGTARLAADTNMFRAAAFAHAPRGGDLLLLRGAAGALGLRELSGALVAGQQEPHVRVPAPGSKEARDTEEGRLVAHVCRELRRRQARAERGRGGAQPPGVSLPELAALFPGFSEATIGARLRERCACQPLGAEDSSGLYVLKPGGSVPVEGELRKVITPDAWCAYESMVAGEQRVAEAGLVHAAELAQVPPDRLRLAFEQLPPSPELERAFEALEVAAGGTPWALTDAFVSALHEGRGRLALTGPGDPTGRGLGFSYMRDDRRAVAEGPAVPKRDAGQITGTSADLRRLSMQKSQEVLLSLGVKEDEIKGLSRWQRIALVRDLSSAAVMDGASKHGARYARAQRQSAVELLQQSLTQAHTIFARQAEVLAKAPKNDEELSEPDSPVKKPVAGKKGKKGAQPAKAQAGSATAALKKMAEEQEEARELAEMRKGGFLSGAAAAGKGGAAGGKLEAAPGARRVRRTIVAVSADGERSMRNVIYSDRDKVAVLNSMYGEGGPGFGDRHIKARAGGAARLLSGRATAAAMAAKLGRKAGTRKVGITCKACGQTGHNSKNRACPMYAATHPQQDGDEGDGDEDARPAPKRAARRNSDALPHGLSQAASAELGADADAPGLAAKQGSEGGRPRQQKRRRVASAAAAADEEEEEDYELYAPGASDSDEAEEEPVAPARPPKAPAKQRPPRAPTERWSARKALCQRVLAPALSAVKRRCGKLLDPFKRPVSAMHAPDYNDFVEPEDELCLEDVERKLKGQRYSGADEFRADVARIVRNATAYNTPGHGQFGGPDIIDMARAMEAAINDELDDVAEKIEDAEARIAAEDGGYAAKSGDGDDDDEENDGGALGADAHGEGAAGAAGRASPAVTEHWVQCTTCQKWRSVTKAVYDATVGSGEDDPWYCHLDYERPNAGCDQPDDYDAGPA